MFFSMILWAITRKTSAKQYSSLAFLVFTLLETTALILASFNVLPTYLTNKQDSTKLIMSLITFYIVITGVGSYDFKVNLFITTPVTVLAGYHMAKIEEEN